MVKIVKISKEEAKRRLGDVAEDKRFWCHDGKLIRNLKELGKALNDMSDETFHYHSGVERKDFSKWVREVVGDEKLANDLSKAKSRIQTSQAVAQRISFLEGRI
ncbi:MAG: hypothetical protein WBH01_06715 [Dehalococcoidia bacterium]